MTDYFSLLDEPHRPWLDPDTLKQKFLALSAEFHPDRVHGADEAKKAAAQRGYSELNQAYNQLRRPKDRLQHFLEVETGIKPSQIQQIPGDLMEFFLQVGQLFKETDAFLVEKPKVSSPLLQVQVFETSQLWTEKLSEFQKKIGARQQELIAELKAIDARWAGGGKSDPVARATMLRRLEELYRLFSYFSRWESQIQERIVQLAV